MLAPYKRGAVHICNLYTWRNASDEIARLFGAERGPPINAPDEVYPGQPGLVVREEGGARVAQSMVWGWPLRLSTMAPTSKPRPVNNVADLAKPMWRRHAAEPRWRCLIPVSAFAEAEGEKGRKTRTWFSVRGQPVFAWAGLWRDSAEWGPVYSGVMTDCNEAIRPVHDRMPVLLMPDEHDAWLRGGLDDALALQRRCFPVDLIEVRRTDEPWAGRR